MKIITAILLTVLATTFSSLAQSDDFNDGNINGWTLIQPLSSNGASGTFTMPSLTYRIQAASSTNVALLGYGRAGSVRTNTTLTNFVESVDVVDWNNSLSQRFGVVARVRDVGFGTMDGYGLLLSPSGQLSINRFDDEVITTLASATTSLSTSLDYRLVFTGVGSALKGQVYASTNSTMPLATIIATDGSYTSGYSGLWVQAGATTADATFDNYSANSGDLIVYDALTSLGTNGSKIYTFTEAISGEYVTIAVTMTPSSTSTNGAAVFTVLDGSTRMAITAGDNSGNWIENIEKVNFTASLVSASSGVATNSVKFGISKLGVRPYSNISWTSSAGTRAITAGIETLYTLDTNTVFLAGTNYTGQFGVSQAQLSDVLPMTGQSIAFTVNFSKVQLSVGTQVGGVTNTAAPSLSSIDANKVLVAANFGGSDLVRDGISFTSMTTSSAAVTNTFGNYTVAVYAPSGSLATATYGDSLFGSFIWAGNQNQISARVDGLNTNKTYQAYYLAGDTRSGFNMFLTVAGSTATDTNSVVGTMSWGSASNTSYYIYLPVTVSNATSLTATMTKNGSSLGVAMSGLILAEVSSTTAPTLTSISTLTNATEDVPFTISYDTLKNASDAADANGDAISFTVESVTSGTLKENGSPVVTGETLLSSGGTLVWTPPTNANGTLDAFTVTAWDGALSSSSPVQVKVAVGAVNDRPVRSGDVPTLTATYGDPFTYTFASDFFTDVESATLTYVFSNTEVYSVPVWLSTDGATRTISGTPTSVGTFGVSIGGSDGQATTYYDPVPITVAKAALVVTPADFTRTQGEPNPTFSGTISGIKNSDNITATYGTAATSASSPGTYPITFTLVDPNGKLANYTVTTNAGTLTVLAPLATPTINLSNTNLCTGLGGYTATGPSGMAGYHWTLSNAASVGSVDNQTLTFNAASVGAVMITLTVTNDLGQTASNSVEATTYAPPGGGIFTTAVCANSTGNTASGPAGMAAYAWTISNGTITSATNLQTITYMAGASGKVGLGILVTSTAGCSSGDYTETDIYPYPSATITTSSNVTANSTGNTASASGGATSYAWLISNGTITSATNLQTITYTAGASGTVGLALTVGNATGCTASSSSAVTITAPVVVPSPLPTSWITNTAGQYVRLYTNTAAKNAGVTVTTWTFSTINGTNVTGTQSNPVYSGIQEIYSSSNWVYLRSSAMPAGPIGPLLAYAPAALLLPYNQKAFFRLPMHPTYTNSKATTPGGAIGFTADGVQLFDIRDALSWTGSSEGQGTGYWTRDAFINEGYGFDPYQGHAAPGGGYHYHANPQGLRYVLGDHVDLNPVTKVYSESTTPVTKHSPILGWLKDGYPLYGPYGYASASNSASGIRRMLSGFVLRDGSNGTANLSTVGRTNIPPWAQRIYGVSTATGPSVASYGPLGRYLEDSDFMGDLINPASGSNFVKGVDYDLDEYNGRWCVTPEFPNGTYAYFVTINADGSAKFPYYIGRAFFGTPSGGTVSNLTETVVTNFVGGTNMSLRLATPAKTGNTVTLTWSGVDGGGYKVEASTNLTGWTALITNATAPKATGAYTNVTAEANTFYKVTRTAVAAFEAVNGSGGGGGGGGGGTGITSVSPTSGSRGTTVALTINLDSAVNPPPQAAPITSVTVGSITGTSNVHVSQTQVTSSITIPAGAATGPQTVTVTFPPPPGGSTNTVYTLPNGFTIQ